MSRFVLIGVVLGMLVSANAVALDTQIDSVVYANVSYIDLHDLSGHVGAKMTLHENGKDITVSTPEGVIAVFANGGDRVRDSKGNETALKKPLLVIRGKYFVPAGECAKVFGYSFDATNSRIAIDGVVFDLSGRKLETGHRIHEPSALEIIHVPLITVGDLPAKLSLHSDHKIVSLPSGTQLLGRRTFEIDGKHYTVVTRCDSSLTSYVVESATLKKRSSTSKLAETHFGYVREHLLNSASKGESVRHGSRDRHQKSICVTVDMCWSLRQFERDWFRSLASQHVDRKLPVTIFLSGRWIEQHPLEMESLISMQHKGVDILWGVHSYAHPKSNGFMNDMSEPEVLSDTLRVEQAMLRWGIIPSVFYRFPGLIHDSTRLKTILSMDLFSIDCESWMAVVGSRHPFGKNVIDGSIILVHGNGNEPKGISRFTEWQRVNPNWRWRPLQEFLPRRAE